MTTTSADLRAEVLHRLRHLTTSRPDRTVHLVIDIAQHGVEPLSIHAVRRILDDLWVDGEVVHVGRGWRLPPPGIHVQLEVAD